MERSGYTVILGLVGRHDHLYYTDSYATQVKEGRISEPGLFVLRSRTRRHDSIGGWRDHDAYYGKPGNLHRLESEETDRRELDARTPAST
jgi:hypothetical protein